MMCVYLSASAEAIAYIKQCLSMAVCEVRAADHPCHQGKQDATSPATVVQRKLNASAENCLIPASVFRSPGSQLDVDGNRSVCTGAASQRGASPMFKYRVLLISWVRTQDRPAEAG